MPSYQIREKDSTFSDQIPKEWEAFYDAGEPNLRRGISV